MDNLVIGNYKANPIHLKPVLYHMKISGMNGKYLLLGSNLGERPGNIRTALERIGGKAGKIISCSSFYNTSSWGISGLPDFCNLAARIETDLEPLRLLENLLRIEETMGRIRDKKWESRIIDIDILYYDNLILDLPGLKVPHPRIPFRRFALVPLTEIAPLEIHPGLGLTHEELLMKTTDNGKVEKMNFLSETGNGTFRRDLFNEPL